MADLESLPPDQRAAVSLLLKQGQTYDQLADLLDVDQAAVRRRAHDALEGLAPEAGPRPQGTESAQVSDYLLGQQTEADRQLTRELLEDSPAARAWARSVLDGLRSLAPPGGLPEIPEGRAAPRPGPAAYEPAPYALEEEVPPASRLGGALLLGGLALVIVVVVILLAGGGDDDRRANTLATNPSTQTATQPSSTQPVAQINLLPPGGGNRPVGLAQIFRRGDQRAIIMAAQGASPGAYALWLYNSVSDARLLGFVPQRVGSDGRFATQGVLPADASRYRSLVVTRETAGAQAQRPPTRPGPIVLQGRLSLG